MLTVICSKRSTWTDYYPNFSFVAPPHKQIQFLYFYTHKLLFALGSGKYTNRKLRPSSQTYQGLANFLYGTLANHYLKRTDWSIELFSSNNSSKLLSLTENIWAKHSTFLLCLNVNVQAAFVFLEWMKKYRRNWNRPTFFSLPRTIGTFRLYCYPAVFPAAYCFCPCHAHCLNFLCSFSVTMGIIYIYRKLESEKERERCIFPCVCFLWVVLCFFCRAERGRRWRRGVYRPWLILKLPSLSFFPSLSLSCPSVQKGLVCYLRWPDTWLESGICFLTVCWQIWTTRMCTHTTQTRTNILSRHRAAPEPWRPQISGFGERVWMGRPVSGLHKNPSVPYAKQSAVFFPPVVSLFFPDSSCTKPEYPC